MKTPLDIVRGRIVGYDERTGEVTIKAAYPDWPTMMKRGYRECNVQMIDSRKLSDKQRNTCYKLLREISKESGAGLDSTKEAMKRKFIEDDLQAGPDFDFSLSDCPMSLACAFERYLVEFILDWDIPVSFPLLDFVDDVQSYIYVCLKTKKCCICGKRSDLHHVDHVGAGRDRDEIIHEGMEALPLCRIHHTEAHTIGQKSFNKKHHIERGVKLDKELCAIYGLRKEETKC